MGKLGKWYLKYLEIVMKIWEGQKIFSIKQREVIFGSTIPLHHCYEHGAQQDCSHRTDAIKSNISPPSKAREECVEWQSTENLCFLKTSSCQGNKATGTAKRVSAPQKYFMLCNQILRAATKWRNIKTKLCYYPFKWIFATVRER